MFGSSICKLASHRLSVKQLALSASNIGPRIALSKSHQISSPISVSSSWSLSRHFSTTNNKDGSKDAANVSDATVYDPRDVDFFVKGIDTTLSPEQKEYVEKLKKRLKGGKNSPKSWFREVPSAEEIKGEGNLMPKYAENAEALIDWALSHVPIQTGPRRSRHKKRMKQRFDIKRENDKRRKEETRVANEKRREKNRQVVRDVQAMKKLAVEVNREREERLMKLGLLKQRPSL